VVSDRPRIALARRYYLLPCQSKEVIKRGFDDTEPARQRYECHGCHGRFDDLTDTILDQRGHLNKYAVQHIFVPLLFTDGYRRGKLGSGLELLVFFGYSVVVS
jgi:transposase-like protein